MDIQKTIYVAGHTGMVGSALVRKLTDEGHHVITRTSKELDLTDQQEVNQFFTDTSPDYVFLAAAKVGGIHANSTYPADFIYRNTMIQANVIHAAYLHGTEKLMFLGSSCIYPKLSDQPIKESELLTGSLEPSNEAYALAKITGLRMCAFYRQQYGCDFISVMPTNLFGINDNFHPENSHVLPALLDRFHKAKLNGDPEVTVWGTGSPLREFQYVDDLADALYFIMNKYSDEEHINCGSGEEVSINDLVYMIKDIVGYEGDVIWDTSKPNGTPRKLMDSTKLKELGWEQKIGLTEGLKRTYEWYLDNVDLDTFKS
jgi:GDP-L-fucose synthase